MPILAGLLAWPSAVQAACTVNSIDLGRFFSRQFGIFAPISSGGGIVPGSGRTVTLRINDCVTGRYRIRITGTGARDAIRVTATPDAMIELVPFAVAMDGTTIGNPIDLRHDNDLVIMRDTRIDIVLATYTSEHSLRGGAYAAQFIVFFDPL